MDTINIAVKVNGKLLKAAVPPRLLLTDFIRQNLSLPGTHVGCEHGVKSHGGAHVFARDPPRGGKGGKGGIFLGRSIQSWREAEQVRFQAKACPALE